MKRLLFILPLLGIIACGGNKKVGAEGISPSSFVGYWVNTAPNDSVQVISVHIGERNDSLLVAIYWTRQEPFFMQEAPFTDGAGCIVPQACLSMPKSGNKAIGTIVNQYFAVYNNSPKNEYLPIVIELLAHDTLTFKISGDVNLWPDSSILVRRSSENPIFSTTEIDVYKENSLVPDANVAAENSYNVAGVSPSPFIGEWGWENNGPWEYFGLNIGVRNDTLLLAGSCVYLGGSRVYSPDEDEAGRLIPQERIIMPKNGNIALNSDTGVTLELFSNNTLLLRNKQTDNYWPDSAVMVRISDKQPLFTE